MVALAPLFLAVALAACGPALPSSPADRPIVREADRPAVSAAEVERAVHAATNAARRRQGLGALTTDDAVARVARRHSADMARRGFFDHTAPGGADANDRAARADLTCRVTEGRRIHVGFAENLAQVWLYSRWRETTGPAGTHRTYDWLSTDAIARQTVDGWMNSPSHRRNLLTPHATREGIGVALTDDGKVFVTQMLC